MDEKITKPTIETVLDRMNGVEQRLLERIDASEQRMDARIDGLGERIDASEQRLSERITALDSGIEASEGRASERMSALEEQLGARLDRIEGFAHTTRGAVLDLRADFKDLRKTTPRASAGASEFSLVTSEAKTSDRPESLCVLCAFA